MGRGPSIHEMEGPRSASRPCSRSLSRRLRATGHLPTGISLIRPVARPHPRSGVTPGSAPSTVTGASSSAFPRQRARAGTGPFQDFLPLHKLSRAPRWLSPAHRPSSTVLSTGAAIRWGTRSTRAGYSPVIVMFPWVVWAVIVRWESECSVMPVTLTVPLLSDVADTT